MEFQSLCSRILIATASFIRPIGQKQPLLPTVQSSMNNRQTHFNKCLECSKLRGSEKAGGINKLVATLDHRLN